MSFFLKVQLYTLMKFLALLKTLVCSKNLENVEHCILDEICMYGELAFNELHFS